MLDETTKRTIKAARDALVGKVPDPKAQVEQITTALIYKFMDDLDKQSIQLGGQARFFSGDYAQYAWSNLMDTRLTGEKRLDLYVRAITSMEKNPNLPQLFRDIFKGAFLPYNDPQTLSLFLKEINKFSYQHSEELGNAYEHLLSIMSSQGDAGQFRTPRHIIDFMVAVVDPKKDETILDPACGTAGFLISSFKHIRKHNSSMFKPEENHAFSEGESAVDAFLQDNPAYNGDLLTPDEKMKLMENIQGYDISPDMVRLSLVNLYLHGFPSPRIYEYDTLTSEECWDDTFDVILANPPFMTPKGGIRPHKRFQVQAHRSEVLFVDYILEHLNINGRAGIIVPEGIIFRNENAYKQLRKMLVEDGLYCVVSLPAGVFNPYSGVKTSILFFDKALAKERDELLFVKIENDGFDLGAQRRKIDKNDLPEALRVVKAWQEGEKLERKFALWVNRENIAANSDFNLIIDRYKTDYLITLNKWPCVKLKDVAIISSGNSAPQSKNFFYDGKFPFFRTSDVGAKHISENLLNSKDKLNEKGIKGLTLYKKGTILFPKSGASTFLNHRAIMGVDGYVSSHLATILADEEKILTKFLFYYLTKVDAKNLTANQNYPSLRLSEIENIMIPLPPLEVQRDIVEQIKVKQAAIDAARAVIDALEKERRYFGRELQNMEGVDWVELGEICEIFNGSRPKGGAVNSGILSIGGEHINPDGSFNLSKQRFIPEDFYEKLKRGKLEFNDILLVKDGATTGKCGFFDANSPFKKAAVNEHVFILRSKTDKVIPYYLFHFLRSKKGNSEIIKFKKGAAQGGINLSIRSLLIPLPPLDVQRRIVEEEYNIKQGIIDSLRNVINLMEEEIKRILSHI